MDTLGDIVFCSGFSFLSIAMWAQNISSVLLKAKILSKHFKKLENKAGLLGAQLFYLNLSVNIFKQNISWFFFCYMENACHFLINPSYNSYGFGLRSWGTFQRQRARKGLVVSEASRRPLLPHRYLTTAAYCSSKPSVYYFCFTPSMQTTYKKSLSAGWF